MDITKRIDDLCQTHHMSKYRLSKLTGISQSAFSKLARQQSSLSLDSIQRICHAFDISLAQFFEEPEAGAVLPPPARESQLLSYWNRLSPEKKDYALLMLEKLSEL